MKLALWSLLAAVAFAVCAAKGGCPEDALRCAGGDVLSRDPDKHCEFPVCPEDQEKHDNDEKKKEREDAQLSKTFTFSNVHL